MITICITDDKKTTRDLFETLIKYDEDLSCAGSFKNGREAVQAIPLIMPDVVLMDIEMPVMDGIAAIRQLKPLCPGVQFMMWTVYDEDEKVFESLKAGATSYILKSSPAVELTAAIKELHLGGSPMSADIARKVVLHFQKQQAPSPHTDVISRREKEVLDLLARGCSYKEVGEKLFISSKTVRKHVFNIYEKLHVNSKIEAVNKYYGGAHL